MIKKSWIFLAVALSLAAVLFLAWNWRLIPYLSEVNSCKEQLKNRGSLSGAVDGPVKLQDSENFVTVGCGYEYIYDTKNEAIRFDVMLFDARGWPYVYRAKIEQILQVCRLGESETVCKSETIGSYKDFPEGKMAVLGILNDRMPDTKEEKQTDLALTGGLLRAMNKGGWYPLGLFSKKIWIWSLSY